MAPAGGWSVTQHWKVRWSLGAMKRLCASAPFNLKSMSTAYLILVSLVGRGRWWWTAIRTSLWPPHGVCWEHLHMGIALVAIYDHVKSLQLILLKVKTQLNDLMLYMLESGKVSYCVITNGNSFWVSQAPDAFGGYLTRKTQIGGLFMKMTVDCTRTFYYFYFELKTILHLRKVCRNCLFFGLNQNTTLCCACTRHWIGFNIPQHSKPTNHSHPETFIHSPTVVPICAL